MQHNGFWILALAILLAASVVPARANLITDPGFESCTSSFFGPPGWARSFPSAFCNQNPHTGGWDTDGSGRAGTLSQTIATIVGDNYDFSFWLWNPVGAPGIFTASFGSDEVLDLVNVGVIASYTLEDFTVTATGTNTTIGFGMESNGGAWSLDDVSVTDQGPATPEPASLLLMGTGLLAIAWRFRRRLTH
jgi:hypothetical protein